MPGGVRGRVVGVKDEMLLLGERRDWDVENTCGLSLSDERGGLDSLELEEKQLN